MMLIFAFIWVEKMLNQQTLFFIHPNEKVINNFSVDNLISY